MGKTVRTVYEVEEENGRKTWIIKRSDSNPVLVGFPTSCGVPYPAKDLGVGTKFETILDIEE